MNLSAPSEFDALIVCGRVGQVFGSGEIGCVYVFDGAVGWATDIPFHPVLGEGDCCVLWSLTIFYFV